jgi:hypothetical protein
MSAMAHLAANFRLSDHRRHRAMPTNSILPLNLRRGGRRSCSRHAARRRDRAKGPVASDSRRAGLLHGARQPIRQLKAQLDALKAALQVDFRVNVDPFRAVARVMW